ncbi:MAG TPA: Crp/Fnr family transcriptional regulator [Smithella sp.]|jgi:CRP/FNR family transcriptional regulator|nr:Crp/Fnr family transcriptional regulator [Smithella sp.]NMC98025.1 Crp/Fnr family transcriptional regulator [Deltaproteobacteria bacterium]OQC53086.1 MAG: cAMP receptor protein [Deltaproteobacteria bacterium ADurb.Bin022]HOE33307.1 Crp/Fnr family transcriptional regulator [Smithella sp.]HOG10784.1 Crp/Fnr family transcriptional regulator [Smithella sp.]
MKKARDILIRSQLFGGLPQEYITEIEKIAVDKHYNKGDIIFYDGDNGVGFYLVAAGSVNVYKLSPDGKEQIFHIVKEGETIGAVPVFSGKSFPANARALSKTHLLFFDRIKFIELISGKPDLTMNILALLSMRLREFTVQVENLSLKEIPGRLASYLLYLAQEQGNKHFVKLNISKLQLSNILGTVPESLSRALSNMKAKKLIEEEDAGIRLLNRAELEDLAERGKTSN